MESVSTPSNRHLSEQAQPVQQGRDTYCYTYNQAPGWKLCSSESARQAPDHCTQLSSVLDRPWTVRFVTAGSAARPAHYRPSVTNQQTPIGSAYCSSWPAHYSLEPEPTMYRQRPLESAYRY